MSAPDVVAFVRARLDEREAAARATEHADGPATLHWRPGGTRQLYFDNQRRESYSAVFAGDWDRILIARDDVRGGPLAKHIALNDPAAVLAWVAATRQRVDLLATLDDACPPDDWPDSGDMAVAAVSDIARHLLKLEALPWREHPGYDPAWNPSPQEPPA